MFPVSAVFAALLQDACLRSAARAVGKQVFSDGMVMDMYVRSGFRYAARSLAWFSEPYKSAAEEEGDLDSLVSWEETYADRGFLPIPISEFKNAVGRHTDIFERARVRRHRNVEPVYHARKERENRRESYRPLREGSKHQS